MSQTKQMCRLCLATFPNIYIFDAEKKICNKIRNCCTLQVSENDGLPDHICADCAKTLDMIKSFKDQCEENDKYLRKQLDAICKLDVVEILSSELSSTHNNTEHTFDSDDDDSYIVPKFDSFMEVDNEPIKIDKFENIECAPIDHTNYPTTLKFDVTNNFLLNNVGNIYNSIVKLNRIPSFINCPKQQYCAICIIPFFKKKDLKRHMVVHSQKKFPCIECGQFYRTRYDAKRHFNAIHGKDYGPIPCSLCSDTFENYAEFQYHTDYVHNVGTISTDQDVPCPLCGQLFKDSLDAKKHMMITHNEVVEIEGFSCDVCSKKFIHKRFYLIHIEKKHGKFECDLCAKRFFNKSSLTVHLKSHDAKKPFECKVCHIRFHLKSLLTGHERRHAKKKTFNCTLCSKNCSRLQQMNNHFALIHPGKNVSYEYGYLNIDSENKTEVDSNNQSINQNDHQKENHSENQAMNKIEDQSNNKDYKKNENQTESSIKIKIKNHTGKNTYKSMLK